MDENNKITFSELGLNENILEAIGHMGFVHPTPVQELAIPLILDSNDLLACAQTGTGKTAAFILPVLHKLVGKEDSSINTLILTPTRELAIQIEQEIQGLSYFVSVGSIALYGGGDGQKWEDQKTQLVEGVDIIVATPGKLISHMAQGYVDFSLLEHLILDEADKMLDMGFAEDIERIVSYLPKKRQTLLFSATMPSKIKALAQSILINPKEIALSISKPAAGVKQFIHLTHDEQKDKLLVHILNQNPDFKSIIIFTSQKSKVGNIAYFLRKNGFKNTEGVSSALEQSAREEVLNGFRSKRTRILVATDVMSRGIDIKDINMVINYDAPRDAEDYVHRIGRTARANTTGEAYTLINPKDMPKLARIERLIEMEIERLPMPEELGLAPEWKVSSSSSKRKKKPFYKKKKQD
ncbi:MAG: DEAD/DEAH box helicase [Fluviicola sp.]|jgi:superfamily II DNA/RNA helicase